MRAFSDTRAAGMQATRACADVGVDEQPLGSLNDIPQWNITA